MEKDTLKNTMKVGIAIVVSDKIDFQDKKTRDDVLLCNVEFFFPTPDVSCGIEGILSCNTRAVFALFDGCVREQELTCVAVFLPPFPLGPSCPEGGLLCSKSHPAASWEGACPWPALPVTGWVSWADSGV